MVKFTQNRLRKWGSQVNDAVALESRNRLSDTFLKIMVKPKRYRNKNDTDACTVAGVKIDNIDNHDT